MAIEHECCRIYTFVSYGQNGFNLWRLYFRKKTFSNIIIRDYIFFHYGELVAPVKYLTVHRFCVMFSFSGSKYFCIHNTPKREKLILLINKKKFALKATKTF